MRIIRKIRHSLEIVDMFIRLFLLHFDKKFLAEVEEEQKSEAWWAEHWRNQHERLD